MSDSTVRCQKCGHMGVPSPTVVLDLESEIRELKAELQEMMRRAQRVGWITEMVRKEVGAVDFCVTDGGHVGVFLFGQEKAAGIGDDAGEAIDAAKGVSTRSGRREDVSSKASER